MCGGGLIRKDNWIELSDQYPGFATVLRNFEPSLYGGYRKINGYMPFNTQHPVVGAGVAEGRILGIAFYEEVIIVARKDIGANTYSFYQFVPFSPWLKISGGYTPDSEGVRKIRYDTFNFDGTYKIVFVDGVNPAVCYDGTSWTVLSGDQIEDSGTPLTPKYVGVFKNHIFVSGDERYPHLVIHSAPNDETNWTAAAGAGQIIAGFAVTQIRPWRDRLIVFGQKEIKYVAVSNTTFILDGITKNLGCISSDSVVEANSDLLFMSQDGVRPISATERNEDFELNSLSKNIQGLFNQDNFHFDAENVNAVVIKKKSQVRFFLTVESAPEDVSRGLLAGLMISPQGQRWEWGELLGIKVACISSGYLDNVETILHGGFDGKVYQQEVGYSFDGRNIPAFYSTPYFDFGDPMLRKTLKEIKVFFRPEGQLDVRMGVAFDWGNNKNNNNMANPYDLVGAGDIARWDRAIYNQSKYSGIPLPYIFKNIVGSGYSMRFVFSSDDTYPSYSIQSVLVGITPNGRE